MRIKLAGSLEAISRDRFDGFGLAQVSLSAALLFSATAPSQAQSVSGIAANPAKVSHDPKHLLLSINPNAKGSEVAKAMKKLNLKVVHVIKNKDKSVVTLVCKCTKGDATTVLPQAIANNAFVDVQLNYRAKIQVNQAGKQTGPNDPMYVAGFTSFLGQLDVADAWARGATGEGVTIASLDTGVDYAGNEDLQGKVPDQGVNLHKKDTPGLETDETGLGHGTVTMTLAAGHTNNHFGQASPAYGASIYPVVVTDKYGYAASSKIIEALNLLESKEIKLAVLSINANPPYALNDPIQSQVRKWAANYYKKGGLLFIAAGNGDSSGAGVNDSRASATVHDVPAFITVSSINSESKPSTFSNYGAQIYFAAPGEDLSTTGASGAAHRVSGTSFSAALAAGVAAQIWSTNPKMSNAEVLAIMQRTASKPTGYSREHFGAGIPDAGNAVGKAGKSF